MNIEVGSDEAKTKLPELLRGVQAGNRYTITLRGETVAELVPAQDNRHSDAVVATMRAVEEKLQRLVALPRWFVTIQPGYVLERQ